MDVQQQVEIDRETGTKQAVNKQVAWYGITHLIIRIAVNWNYQVMDY